MKPRSPSIDRICAAAVVHFAERGYAAASLNDIAQAVGIRKASLYTHFASKDALFMETFGDALTRELQAVAEGFSSNALSTQPGAAYCTSLAQRYDTSHDLRFLLRTAYLPPPVLRAQISEGYETYLDALQAGFQAQLAQAAPQIGAADRALFGQAYLGIVDSLHVELLYAGKNYVARLQAMQRLLQDALHRATTA